MTLRKHCFSQEKLGPNGEYGSLNTEFEWVEKKMEMRKIGVVNNFKGLSSW